jgi:hypothetical protein
MELVGLAHWVATDRLAAIVGDDIVTRDPRVALARAASELAEENRS